MKIVKNFLLKNSSVYALIILLKNFRNKNFIDKFVNFNNDYNKFNLNFVSLGKQNHGKIISLFNIEDPNTGFFAIFRYVLNFLYISDKFGFSPVINYNPSFLYSESEQINGSTNPFEYYFEKVSKITYAASLDSTAVFKFDISYNFIAEESKTYNFGYSYDNDYLKRLAEVNLKYIKLKQNVRDFIFGSIDKLFNNNRVLGVHIRGTDFKGNFNNHPKSISIEDYIPIIKQAIATHKFDKIFLATDDQRILDKFLFIFPDITIFFDDVQRSSNDLAVGFLPNNRKHHKYKLGLEVLRDMHTLAKCHGFICGMSQVSICAQIQKISNNETFDFLHVIDKGMNKNKKVFNKYINIHKKK